MKADFTEDYWKEIYKWYEVEGNRHVAAYLRNLDVSAFDPKAPPPLTPAWRAIVGSNAAPEESELSDVLDALGRPDAVLLGQVIGKAAGDIYDWLTERKNRRIIPIHMERAGYALVPNPTAADGVWKINDRRQPAYAKKTLTYQQQIKEGARRRGKIGDHDLYGPSPAQLASILTMWQLRFMRTVEDRLAEDVRRAHVNTAACAAHLADLIRVHGAPLAMIQPVSYGPPGGKPASGKVSTA